MRLRTWFIGMLLLLVGTLLFGCGGEPVTTEPAAAPETVAEAPAASDDAASPTTDAAVTVPTVDPDRATVGFVNNAPLYEDELEDAKNALLNQYEQTYAQFGLDLSTLMVGGDGRLFELGIEAEAFLQLVQEALTKQEADRQGIEITADEVQQEFESQYQEFLLGQGWTEADFVAYLTVQGRTMETFKTEVLAYIADQLLALEVQRAVAGPLEITDEELAAYFEENRANYEQVERVRASHILVETRDEAEEILAELAGGADFAELARTRSIDTASAVNGGDLSWFGRGAMVEPFEEAVFGLEIGQQSGIVETDYGYHIILLTDHQDASIPTLDDVRDQVREDLEGELAYERAVEWYDEAFNSAVIDVANPLLEAAIKQTTDVDLSIDVLERAQAEGSSDDPYLTFVLGVFYVRKIDALQLELVDADEDAAAQLTSAIAAYKDKAVAAFQTALEAVGDDPTIQSRIDELVGAADEGDT